MDHCVKPRVNEMRWIQQQKEEVVNAANEKHSDFQPMTETSENVAEYSSAGGRLCLSDGAKVFRAE